MKMDLLQVLLILVAFGGILTLIHIIIYNRIIHYKMRIDESESIIDECLRSRYDHVIRAINIFNTITKEDIKDLTEFENFDKNNISNYEMDRKLTKIVGLLKTLVYDYPILEDNRGYTDTLKDLKLNEEKLEGSKLFYNKYTTCLNKYINKVPSNIVARLHKVYPRKYFDGKNLDDDIINDFKL